MDTAGIVVFDGRLSFPVIAKPVRTPAVAIRAPVQVPVFRPSSFVFRPSSPVIANPHSGCGNPFLPSKLPSLVLRNPRGISRGPQPPGRWGRIPKGTAFGIGSLWRVFAYFLHVEKVGRRRRRDRGTNRSDERRIRREVEDCPLRRGREQDESISPAGDPISFSGKEMGKRNRQREPISRRSPLDSLPDDQGGSAPIGFPGGGLQGTGDGRRGRSRCGGDGGLDGKPAFLRAQQAAQRNAVPLGSLSQCIIALSPMLWKSFRASCINSSLGGSTLLSLYLMPRRSYLVAPNL